MNVLVLQYLCYHILEQKKSTQSSTLKEASGNKFWGVLKTYYTVYSSPVLY